MSTDPDGWVAEAAARQRSALLAPPQPWGTGLRVTGPGRGAVPPFSDMEGDGSGAAPRSELAAALSAVVGRLVNTLMMTDSRHMVVRAWERVGTGACSDRFGRCSWFMSDQSSSCLSVFSYLLCLFSDRNIVVFFLICSTCDKVVIYISSTLHLP